MPSKKTLVIVESPAKAKTISRYLGENFSIKASVGHIRDLPASTLGVDVKNAYQPLYVTMKGKEKVVKELKLAKETAEEILIATDPDREGEAIAWHLSKVLKIDPLSPCRVTFNEITKKTVQEAIQQPRSIDLNLVDAQQARRILDRLVGYELSPLLWKKIQKGLSAGRVQSVATRMIVDREEEIERFIPEEYWHLDYQFKTDKDEVFWARYYGELENDKVKKNILKQKDIVQHIQKDCQNDGFKILSVDEKEKKRSPYAPYTTSTLQQDATRRLSFSSRKTMSIAQQLYEGVDLGELGLTALVTYIRTDSVRISNEAMHEARNIIEKNYGVKFLSPKPRFYKNKNASQDAHEAIRPAHFDLEPKKIQAYLSTDQFKLYSLIWQRFLMSQMADARLSNTTVDIEQKKHVFRITDELVKFPGFLFLQEQASKKIQEKDLEENEEQEGVDNILASASLSHISINTKIQALNFKHEQKFTKPPARYNEASLIKALEEAGIGRPSTYAPTISTVLDRKYASKEQKQLVPTELGTRVTRLLKEHFPSIVNIQFTASMENELDTVEQGERNWVSILDEFYPSFHALVEKSAEDTKSYKSPVQELEEACPICGHTLILREGRFGQFIACSNFPSCKYTRNVQEDIPAHCPRCGSRLESRRTKKGSVFYVCAKDAGDPNCDFTSWYLPIDGQSCPYCSSHMVLKKFGRRIYPSCSNLACPSLKKNQKKESDRLNEAEEQESSLPSDGKHSIQMSEESTLSTKTKKRKIASKIVSEEIEKSTLSQEQTPDFLSEEKVKKASSSKLKVAKPKQRKRTKKVEDKS